VRLTTAQAGDVLVVTVNERRLDRSNRERFKEAMAGYLRPGVKIALGLDGVRHLDGPGCGAVLFLQRATAGLGGEIKVFALQQPVRALYQKLRLHRRVQTFNHWDEAMRSFQDEG
jgi:anti-anti-sigma regulatory factor